MSTSLLQYEQQHASASLQPQQIPGTTPSWDSCTLTGVFPVLEKRKRTPLSIVNPESREVLELPKPIAPEIPTPTSDDQVQNDPPGSSTVKTTKPVDVVDKTQKQADFRKDFARLLADAPPSTDKVLPRNHPASDCCNALSRLFRVQINCRHRLRPSGSH